MCEPGAPHCSDRVDGFLRLDGQPFSLFRSARYRKVVWLAASPRCQDHATMRMNIQARLPKRLSQDFRGLPLFVTIETARGIRANYQHSTTAQELLDLLDKRTDLNAAVLDRFREELRFAQSAKLSDIEMSEDLLETLGFFV